MKKYKEEILMQRFQNWWDDEGSIPMSKKEKLLKIDQEEFIYLRCKEAWSNGAYIQREVLDKDNA